MQNKTAMYLRKSRQDEGGVAQTLRKHREILLEFANKNNIKIEQKNIYEETISGESLYSRPQMLKLLQDVSDGMFDAVLCIDIDRLGRGGMSDQGIIFETFKNSDTKIITPRKIYDLNDDFDEDNIEFESFMARRELKIIKRRLRRGTKKCIEEGCYLANAPYGYKKVTVNKKATLQIVEEEASFVRLIFSLYINGNGCQTIADIVNSMGAKPRRSEKFNRTSIMFILKNNVYIGKIVWDKKTHIKKNTNGSSKHITIHNPKESWTISNGLHTPIIDEQTWNAAQKIITEHSHPPTNNGEIKNILSGLLYCGKCGKLMSRTKSKGVEYYRCLTRGCIKQTQVEFVNNFLYSIIKSTYKDLIIDIEKENKTICYDYSKDIKKVKASIKKLDMQMNNLYDLLEQKIYSTEIFNQRQKSIIKQKNKLLQRLADFEKQMLNNDNSCTDCTISNTQEALKLIEILPAKEQNEMLKVLIDSIIYTKNKTDAPNEFSLYIKLKPLHLQQ